LIALYQATSAVIRIQMLFTGKKWSCLDRFSQSFSI